MPDTDATTSSPATGIAQPSLDELCARLEASEARHRLTADASGEGSWYWDVRRNTYAFNDRLLEILGVPRADWGGRFDDFLEHVHPDDRPALDAALRAHLEHRAPYEVEFRLRTASGEYRTCLARGHAEWDAAGTPVRMAAGLADVTDRRRAERALRETAEAQGFLIEASELLAGSIDYEVTLGNVARAAVPRVADWCSVHVLDDAGVPREIVVAHKDPAMVARVRELSARWPQDPDSPYGVPQVVRSGKPEMFEEIPDALLAAAARDPEHLAAMRALGLRSSMSVPLVGRDRTVGALSLVSAESGKRYGPQDLALAMELARRAGAAVENAKLYAEVRRLNQTLEERVAARTAELVEVNHELEAFSYTVSHDLRAPIRHIAGFVELLERHSGDKLDERGRRYLTTIGGAAKQMGLLIDALLAFSRTGRAELSRARVPLGPLVRAVLRELEPDLAGRVVRFDVGELPDVLGDATMLRQVLANLVSNAVKYTRPRAEAHVAIGARALPGPGDEVECFVRDDGVGFDARYADKLFGVFQRLHSANDFEGTGIGLATVRRIVQRHGGRTRAESVEGAGATFYFTLPAAPREN